MYGIFFGLILKINFIKGIKNKIGCLEAFFFFLINEYIYCSLCFRFKIEALPRSTAELELESFWACELGAEAKTVKTPGARSHRMRE